MCGGWKLVYEGWRGNKGKKCKASYRSTSSSASVCLGSQVTPLYEFMGPLCRNFSQSSVYIILSYVLYSLSCLFRSYRLRSRISRHTTSTRCKTHNTDTRPSRPSSPPPPRDLPPDLLHQGAVELQLVAEGIEVTHALS